MSPISSPALLPVLLLAGVPCTLETTPAATACRDAGHAEAGAPADQDADPRAAREALLAGDYRRARAILADVIVTENVAEAERRIAAGNAIESLVLLDEALELRPKDPALIHLRGAAAFAAAEEPGASNPGFFYEDALEHYREAERNGYGVVAWFDASRAARRVPKPDEALALVRTGAARLAELESPPRIEPPVERIWAEAAFDVFRERMRDGLDHQAAFAETEDALGRLLGQTPEDAWPREQLANLYQWVGDDGRAVEQLTAALEFAPDRQDLHDRLLELAPPNIGFPALTRIYVDFSERAPESARAWRNRGVAEFYTALEGLDEGAGDAGAFRAAEGHLRRARELDPAWQQNCLGFEAVCRDGVGWCLFNAGELSAAKEAFLSMEDLFDGGLQWGMGERLPDGIQGLGWIVGQLIDRPNELDSLDKMIEAAAIVNYLHKYQPEDGDLANNAGFVNRDVAWLFERKARLVRSEAQRATEVDQQAALGREADQLLARAQEVMESSQSAYEVAARLLPDNVRIVNDTGLVIVYYTREDPELGERYLLSAVEKGTAQLAEDDARAEDDPRRLNDDDRFDLNEAWGDAHQNMGILELTIRRRGAEAKRWLARSLEIGPESREQIRPLLDVCDRMIAGEEIDMASDSIVSGMVWLQNPRR